MRKKANLELRQYAEQKDVKFYEIANEMKKSYDWFSRKIRLPLTEEETAEMKAVIDSIYEREVEEWKKK